MSQTMKTLNDNNVTEVTFLGGRDAVIFYLSSSPLEKPIGDHLCELAAEHYYRETVWTLTLQPAESWEQLMRPSASHQWEIPEPDRFLNIQPFPLLLVSYGALIMCIPALARCSQSVRRCCFAFDWCLLYSRGKHIRNNKSCHFFPPHQLSFTVTCFSLLLFQQMSSVFLQWLALEGHIHFSRQCAKPKWFECLPLDNNKIQNSDPRNENNWSSHRDRETRQHGFCQYKANSSVYIKPSRQLVRRKCRQGFI